MLDHQEARLWADHRGDFADAAFHLLRQVRKAFIVLARIRYDRPWARPQRLR